MGIGDMRLLRVWYDLRLGTHEVTGFLQTREERSLHLRDVCTPIGR